MELVTGVAFVGVMWWALGASTGSATGGWGSATGEWGAAPEFWPLLIAYLYLAAISIALFLIDLDVHRLPNAIVLPSYLVLALLFTLACVLGTPWQGLLRAAIGGLALFAFYFLLSVVKPGGMGGGDVKLAGVLGAAMGWIGWGSLIVGAFAAFLVGGLVGVALMLSRKATRKTRIPFGPFMVVGAWIGIFVGETIAGWYTGLLTIG